MASRCIPNFYCSMGKRYLDIALAVAALLVSAPLLLVVSFVVLVSFGTPVFFRQVRPGLGGRSFTILKFRTMTIAFDRKGNDLRDDMRLTRLGKLLRSTSLDELPELLNVLKGDMSLVGPRPLLMEYLPKYSPEQYRRHEVRPGITGWAQVHGRNTLEWTERFKLDVWYVDNLSLKLDLKILWLTMWKTIRREGINEPGQATASPFRG
jgi:lipopolysaccharide/colanic/teichoic acid biosynthesis glycosyltransferase